MQKARLSVYEDTLKHEAGRGKKSTQKISSPSRLGILDIVLAMDLHIQVHMVLIVQTGAAVWKSRWPSWAFCPNEPYGFCGRKATLNHA